MDKTFVPPELDQSGNGIIDYGVDTKALKQWSRANHVLTLFDIARMRWLLQK